MCLLSEQLRARRETASYSWSAVCGLCFQADLDPDMPHSELPESGWTPPRRSGIWCILSPRGEGVAWVQAPGAMKTHLQHAKSQQPLNVVLLGAVSRNKFYSPGRMCIYGSENWVYSIYLFNCLHFLRL